MSPSDWLQYSVFSNLAYVEWDNNNSRSGSGIVGAAAYAKRLPQSQGEKIFANDHPWTIPSYFPNDNTGFAANTFQRENEVVLAIRGTETNLAEALPFTGELGLVDLWGADTADIGLLGIALHQTVSLVNYVLRLSAPLDADDVQQVALHSTVGPASSPPTIDVPFIRLPLPEPIGVPVPDSHLYMWLDSAEPGTGLGVLGGDANVTVTGHSLGGHLAAVAMRLFPELFDAAITFNAPGFDPATSLVLTDSFVALFGNFLDVPPAQTFGDVADRITAIESENSAPEDDISFVASLFTGVPVGEEVLVRVENNSHSMDQIMDALAVHALVANLNSQLEPAQLFALYDGMSTDPGTTEEALLAALSRAILGEAADLPVVEAGLIGTGDFPDRMAMHDLIVALQGAVEEQNLSLQPIWDMTAVDLADSARNNSAYMHALQYLDPFVIQNPAHVPDSSSGFSADYWLARAEMLIGNFASGVGDGLAEFDGQKVTFLDLGLGVEIEYEADDGFPAERVIFAGEVPGPPAMITGGSGAELIFGGTDDDRLAGGAGADSLDGGPGSDVLYGSIPGAADDGASDLLAGGMGADFYYADSGDVIVDTDRLVAGVYLAGQSMGGVYEQVEVGLFVTADGMRMLQIDEVDAHLSLLSTPEPAYITIRNFMQGLSSLDDPGYALELVIPGEGPTPSGVITLAGTDHDDNLGGTTSNDGIAGLGGDDVIVASLGSDFVDAGPGNDVVINLDPRSSTGDAQGDVLGGGQGNDALSGNDGGDWLLGGDGDDFAQGGGGADRVEGGNGSDVLTGGHGDDLIYGGAGDDAIDADLALIDLDVTDWIQSNGGSGGPSLLRQVPAEAVDEDDLPGSDTAWGGSGADDMDGGGGDDVLNGETGDDALAGGDGFDGLYGGPGADWLKGGDGGDFLDGGLGADLLDGGDGNDTLFGGQGDDRLAGGAGSDVLAGGVGSDRYAIEEGEGWDSVIETPGMPADFNWILMPMGQSAWDYVASRRDDDLVLEYLADDAGIRIANWFLDPDSSIDEIRFDDAILDGDDLAALANGQGSRWGDFMYGTPGNDQLNSGSGEDVVLGEDGDDSLDGGPGADELLGEAGDDILYGGAGGDYINGGAGDDVLVAAAPGDSRDLDSLTGEEGNDLYVVEIASGSTVYISDLDIDGDDADIIRFCGGLKFDDLLVSRGMSGGVETSAVELVFHSDGNAEPSRVVIFNWFGSGTGRIEQLQFDDGSPVSHESVTARINTATEGRDLLSGGGGELQLFGMGGDDIIEGTAGRNILQGDDGRDVLDAVGSANVLFGGNGDDSLTSQLATSGESVATELLLGGWGRDSIHAAGQSQAGNGPSFTYTDGGSGADNILLESRPIAIVAGGPGFDRIQGELCTMDVVILQNAGEQGDVLMSSTGWDAAPGAAATPDPEHVLSFGGGITSEDISLRQEARDLIIGTGGFDGVRLIEYFDVNGEPSDWLTSLQFITQATPDYDQESPQPSASSPVMVIDFAPIVEQYIQERQLPGTPWSLQDGAWQEQIRYLQESAIGGQLAYQYGLLGSGTMEELGLQADMLPTDMATTGLHTQIDRQATEPEATFNLGPQSAQEAQEFHLLLPEGWIVDPLTGTPLEFDVSGGLPDWLFYDRDKAELSGIPAATDAGTVTITFSATSSLGQTSLFSVSIVVAEAGSEEEPALVGTPGDDVLEGTEYSERLYGGAGHDEIHGMGGSDWLYGGDGRDTVLGGSGHDVLSGDAGRDMLLGGEGNDLIMGGSGDDAIWGEAGDDILVAGPGKDRLLGGSGDDLYVVEHHARHVRIVDDEGISTIDLSATGTVDEAEFRRRDDDLGIRFEEGRARILLTDWFSADSNPLNTLLLADGEALFQADTLRLIQHRVSRLRDADAPQWAEWGGGDLQTGSGVTMDISRNAAYWELPQEMT